jgi:hypothetical protein
LDSKFVIVSKISCNYPWFSKKIFLQTEANLYSVKSDIWLILLQLLYIRSAIILINSKHTQVVAQSVTSLKKDRLFFNLSADTDVTSYLIAEKKGRIILQRSSLSYPIYVYLMLHTEVWVYFSFIVVPAAYFKSLVDERNKMNAWITSGNRVLSFRNLVTPTETVCDTFVVIFREVIWSVALK